jgi:hypothetical protein
MVITLSTTAHPGSLRRSFEQVSARVGQTLTWEEELTMRAAMWNGVWSKPSRQTSNLQVGDRRQDRVQTPEELQ